MPSGILRATLALSLIAAVLSLAPPADAVLSMVSGPSPTIVAASAEIPNLSQVSPILYRGGMPTDSGLALLQQAGITTIVSLANENKYLAAERDTAHRLGLKFVHIPLSLWRKPSQNDIDGFLQTVTTKNGEPTFLHCVHGTDRTGTMVAIYRIRYNGWSAEQAYEEMKDTGFRPFFHRLASAVFNFEKHH